MQRILFALFKWPLPRNVVRALKALFWVIVLLYILEVFWLIGWLVLLKAPPYWQYVLFAWIVQFVVAKVVVNLVNFCQFHPHMFGVKARYRYKAVE